MEAIHLFKIKKWLIWGVVRIKPEAKHSDIEINKIAQDAWIE
jgi:hypothetical protein